MPSFPVLKALGLSTSPNQLEVPEGSLIQASNVIIRRDNVIEPRRGFKLYGQSFGTSTDTLKQMFVYRERLLRHYNDILEFQNGINNDGSVHFDEFDGSFEETEEGLRIKSIESNGNFYFTTSEGIKKISAKTGSQLSTVSEYITQAGGVKALDITGKVDIELGNQTGFLPQDSAVAYRHIWGYFDANNNLVVGTPSERAEVFNPLDTLLIRDLNNLLLALDNIDQTGSLITDGNYVSTLALPISASASEVRTNLIALGAKLDNDIEITEGAIDTATGEVTGTNTLTLVFNSSVATYIEIGDRLTLSGFTSAGLTQLNGREFDVTNVATTTVTATVVGAALANQASTADTGGVVKRSKYSNTTLFPQPTAPSIPATDDELVDIQDYLSSFIVALQTELTGIISTALSDDFIQPLDITTTANVKLRITIPEAITTDYFVQVYRSSITQATGAVVLSDLVPNDEMQLVYEAFPTAAEISAGFLEFIDITPEAFLGAFLYTNEASGEGLTQANDLPPFAKDINRFKNSIFYANTRTRHRKLLSLLGVVNMLTDYNNGLNTKTFGSGDVDTSSEYIMIASHGFINGQSVRFTNSTPSNLPGGLTQGITYYILNADTNSFQVTTSRDSTTPVNLTSGGTGTHTILNILPTITITNGTITQTYSFIKGIKEVTPITAIGDAGSLDGTYFYLNSANDDNEYYVYYQENGASDSDPLIPERTAVPVYFNSGATAMTIAALTRDALNALHPEDFSVIASGSLFTITNVDFGYTTDATAQTSGFTIGTITQGAGENASTNEVLLSDNSSPAIAVDETAKSFVRVINQNLSESIYAFYLSTSETVPGRIFLESRTLDEDPFYLIPSSETVGESFSPDLSPTLKIVSISVANPTVITTSSAHGLITGDEIIVGSSNSTPTINGIRTVTVLTSTTFSISVNVTVAGTYGTIIPASQAEVSENELKPNRVYFSKISQPEAVPLTNYFDVGAEEKQILRIFPLRDSLFVFKEDGLYRISGENAPFVLSLFDQSTKLIASDSIALVNNLIYGWTEQGINTISESGVSNPISRPIDNVILKLQTPQYTNFTTSTFGIGYESDNAYYIWTVSNTTDELATICYRFSTQTGTWTTFDKTNTCGLVSDVDDKIYLGAGDTNFTEQERKDFTRHDYADRELSLSLTDGNYFDNQLKFSSVSGIEEGDVIVQEQTVTVYTYNSLLKKLDIDPGVNDSNYFSTLESSGGDNLRDKLIELTQKLDADLGVSSTDYESTIASKSGTISAISAENPTHITDVAHGLFTGRKILISGSNSIPSINGNYTVTVLDADNFTIDVNVITAGTTGAWLTLDDDFDDMLACYNKTIHKLNVDTGVSYGNYQEIESITIQEAIITEVNALIKRVTSLNLDLDFIVGPVTCFKSYNKEITYTPLSAGDPLSFKQFYEATMMFDNKAFTNATLSFGSDLLPAFNEIEFNGDGNGIFGHSNFGSGFFGGGSHPAPFRTYVPLNAQRCRYLTIKFNHDIARESFAINGLTGTYNPYSVRAYK